MYLLFFIYFCHYYVLLPIVQSPRRYALAIRDEVKNELENMVEMKVIEIINKPTEWVSSLAYSRKSSGNIRICLDPKNLNEVIRIPHYPTPILEEVTYRFEGETVFSKLDARSGYWSITLDDESSTLMTFNTPFGRYRFLRLPRKDGHHLRKLHRHDIYCRRYQCLRQEPTRTRQETNQPYE